jgi:hypothetical protein
VFHHKGAPELAFIDLIKLLGSIIFIELFFGNDFISRLLDVFFVLVEMVFVSFGIKVRRI